MEMQKYLTCDPRMLPNSGTIGFTDWGLPGPIPMGKSTSVGVPPSTEANYLPDELREAQAHLAWGGALNTGLQGSSKPDATNLPLVPSPLDLHAQKNIEAVAYEPSDWVQLHCSSVTNPVASQFQLAAPFALDPSYLYPNISPTCTTAPSMISDNSSITTYMSREGTISSRSSSFTTNFSPTSMDMTRTHSAPTADFDFYPSNSTAGSFFSPPPVVSPHSLNRYGSLSRPVLDSNHSSADLQRTLSQSTTSSTTSKASRRNSHRPSCAIVPRQDTTIITSGNPDGPHMARIESSDGSSRDVGVLPKLPSPPRRNRGRTSASSGGLNDRNPKKLFCSECNKNPDGFRGEHELQRHFNLRHSDVRTFWICVDPTPNGDFLSKCHHCMSEKRYGQYYNAAAHLRRVHFNPRRRGRKSKKQPEKRAGSAGGKHPDMDELKKHWLRQIKIRAGELVDEGDDDMRGSKTSSAQLEVDEEAKIRLGVWDGTADEEDGSDLLQQVKEEVPHPDWWPGMGSGATEQSIHGIFPGSGMYTGS